MAIAASTAIMISAIIQAIIGAAATVGVTIGTQAYEDGLIRKADEKKATYSDILKLIDKLTISSRSISSAQQNALYNKLNQIFTNNYYTSGLSEEVLGTVRQKVQQVKLEVEKHVSLGDAFQKASEVQAQALGSMSAGERAKAKDEQGNWDLDTVAGRAGSEAEKYANAAKEEYDKAKTLGEKYV